MSRTKKKAFKKGKGGGGGPSKPKPNVWQNDLAGATKRGGEWMSEFKNPAFEAYYIDQGIVPQENWVEFMASFRRPLPTTFRFTAGKTTTPMLIASMTEKWAKELSGIEFEGEAVSAPQALPWYPESLAWQVDVKKTVLRKQEQFKDFQKFLVNETEVGSLSRQEAVSMIPPLFLDVRPEHLVLDMCAAPGSKTAQLIEALHSPTTSSSSSYDPCPPGLIIANDSDQKRAYMLVHQATRLPSPNICVTNVDAGAWPRVQVPYKEKDDPAAPIIAKDLKFDRVLGDVPCSGDGTLRKNITIWKDWSPSNANGLHALQVRILLRGLKSLRPGGRLVFSTCSLNPIENEAVVAAALRECGADPVNGKRGSVRIVDVSDHSPELKRAPGLTKWKVCPGRGRHLFEGSADNLRPKQDPQNASANGHTEASTEADDLEAAENAGPTADPSRTDENATEEPVEEQPAPGSAEYRAKLPAIPWVDSWERLQELDRGLAGRTAKTMWPQGDEAALGIERCMRVYPHFQNTGGFFITVLEKEGDAEAPSMSTGIHRAMQALDEGAAEPSYAGSSSTASAAAVASSSKRPLSPSNAEEDGSAGDSASKRVKSEVSKAEAVAVSDTAVVDNSIAEPSTNADQSLAQQVAIEDDKGRGRNDGHGIPGGVPFREDPFTFIPPTNEQCKVIKKFFSLSSDFPVRNLLTRNNDGNPVRTIYLTSTVSRALITAGGPGFGQHRTANVVRLRILNAGVKTFARQESNKSGDLECKWRIVSDGLVPVRSFIAKDAILEGDLNDLKWLLEEYYPTTMSGPTTSTFQSRIKDAKMGSHVLCIQPSSTSFSADDTQSTVTLNHVLDLPIWRAAASVNLMLDKTDRSALGLRVFGKDLSENAKRNWGNKRRKEGDGDGEADGEAEEDKAAEKGETEAEAVAVAVAVAEEQGESEVVP